MKIAIICNENQQSWIIGKFAEKLKENCLSLGHDCEILNKPDHSFDINHHVYYRSFQECEKSLSTFMITHVDTSKKYLQLKESLNKADLGICMSLDTVKDLLEHGFLNTKITYIHPAHDSNYDFLKTKLGIFSNIYDDKRKNEDWLLELTENISPEIFEFVFVGSGWEQITEILRNKKFHVKHSEFSREEYDFQISKIDYWLYLGFDEGSMSFLDALQLGIKTICSAQGFQNDLLQAIDYPFYNKLEFFNILTEINAKQLAKKSISNELNWLNFAKKHIEIWNFLKNDSKSDLSSYKDGLIFFLENQNTINKPFNNALIWYSYFHKIITPFKTISKKLFK